MMNGIGILFIISSLASLFEMSKDGSSTSYPTKSLQVIENKWCYGDFGVKSVCGVIVNNSNKQKSYVQVEINLYDA